MMGTETNTCDSATAAETEVVETTPAAEETHLETRGCLLTSLVECGHVMPTGDLLARRESGCW
jgi:hypothetical protein